MSEERRTEDNGWDEYKKLVLSELSHIAIYTKETREIINKHCTITLDESTRNNKEMVNLVNALELRILEKISPIQQEIAALKVKAGAWGVIAAIGTVLVALGIFVVQQALAASH